MRGFLLSGLCSGFLLLSGCGDGAATSDEAEERDPHVISGQKLVEEGQYARAIEVFHEALENEPNMARPHLDIAMTHQRIISSEQGAGGDISEHVDHHVNAIYHYGRYLELRPDAEKAEFINEQKLKVTESLAVFLINRSPKVREVVTERNQLAQERVELKRQLAAALQRQSTPTAGQTVTRTVPKTTTTTPTTPTTTTPSTVPGEPQPQPKYKIHHVVSGDNLYKLANEFYGDSSKWDIIFEANKDSMKQPNDLKVGQTLVIPVIGN